eukprot:COSAG01_NODE_1620_length_9713_cov_4.117433_5_plen_52_part_00
MDMLEMYMPETYKAYKQWCDGTGDQTNNTDDDRNPAAFYVRVCLSDSYDCS